MIKVYIAGPYSSSSSKEVEKNIKKSIHVADKLLSLGYFPFVPHLIHFWDLVCPRTWEEWLEYDMEWLKECNAVLRLCGVSKGADEEVLLAVSLGIPVFVSIKELEEWRQRKDKRQK